MKHFDYIIVGRGIAGAVLSLQILEQNKTVLVIDNPELSSCSKVAAGLYNPLVFKKLNKIWLADTVIPIAETFYLSQEKKNKKSFWNKKKLLRIFSSAGEQNDFELLKDNSSYQNYIESNQEEPHELIQQLHSPHKTGIVSSCGNLDVKSFLDYQKEQFLALNALEECTIDHEKDIVFSEEKWLVKNKFSCNKLIFAEGWKIKDNPFFNYLPMVPAKGDVLIIECKNLSQEYILNGGCFVLPIGNHRFKVGSTFNWKELNDEISEEGKNELTEKLQELIKLPFTIIQQEAGVRPSSKDRRPLLGEHPNHKRMYVFNGLGTRGVILAPWLAQQLLNAIEMETEIHQECSISRFKKN